MADEPVDTVGPWSLKAVPAQTRQTVIRAARRENLTVGQWLERRVREWTEAGSPVAVTPPHQQPTGDDLAVIERTIAAAVSLAGAPDVPKALRQRVNRLLRAGLPSPVPRSELRPRRLVDETVRAKGNGASAGA